MADKSRMKGSGSPVLNAGQSHMDAGGEREYLRLMILPVDRQRAAR
jgi:hypothetical protein